MPQAPEDQVGAPRPAQDEDALGDPSPRSGAPRAARPMLSIGGAL